MRRLAPLAVLLLCCVGCSDVVYQQTRQPPSRGGVSPWLRTEDTESYQTPWRSPALATNEDNQPPVRQRCDPPGPAFPPTAVAGVAEPRKPGTSSLPSTTIGKQAVFSDQDPVSTREALPVAGLRRSDPITATREPRGTPPIGGYDRRPAPYTGQAHGVEPSKMGAMRLKQDDWCLDEER